MEKVRYCLYMLSSKHNYQAMRARVVAQLFYKTQCMHRRQKKEKFSNSIRTHNKTKYEATVHFDKIVTYHFKFSVLCT